MLEGLGEIFLQFFGEFIFIPLFKGLMAIIGWTCMHLFYWKQINRAQNLKEKHEDSYVKAGKYFMTRLIIIIVVLLMIGLWMGGIYFLFRSGLH